MRGPNAQAFPGGEDQAEGLICRDYIATHIMAGMLAAYADNSVKLPKVADAARDAVEYADALIAELAKPQKSAAPTATSNDWFIRVSGLVLCTNNGVEEWREISEVETWDWGWSNPALVRFASRKAAELYVAKHNVANDLCVFQPKGGA